MEKETAKDPYAEDRKLFAQAIPEALNQKLERELEEVPPADLPVVIDVTGTPLCPGHPKICLGSGDFPGFDCCCDSCDFYLACFPEAIPEEE